MESSHFPSVKGPSHQEMEITPQTIEDNIEMGKKENTIYFTMDGVKHQIEVLGSNLKKLNKEDWVGVVAHIIIMLKTKGVFNEQKMSNLRSIDSRGLHFNKKFKYPETSKKVNKLFHGLKNEARSTQAQFESLKRLLTVEHPQQRAPETPKLIRAIKPLVEPEVVPSSVAEEPKPVPAPVEPAPAVVVPREPVPELTPVQTRVSEPAGAAIAAAAAAAVPSIAEPRTGDQARMSARVSSVPLENEAFSITITPLPLSSPISRREEPSLSIRPITRNSQVMHLRESRDFGINLRLHLVGLNKNKAELIVLDRHIDAYAISRLLFNKTRLKLDRDDPRIQEILLNLEVMGISKKVVSEKSEHFDFSLSFEDFNKFIKDLKLAFEIEERAQPLEEPKEEPEALAGRVSQPTYPLTRFSRIIYDQWQKNAPKLPAPRPVEIENIAAEEADLHKPGTPKVSATFGALTYLPGVTMLPDGSLL